MNPNNETVIKLISSFMDDLNSFRQCSKYLNKIKHYKNNNNRVVLDFILFQQQDVFVSLMDLLYLHISYNAL